MLKRLPQESQDYVLYASNVSRPPEHHLHSVALECNLALESKRSIEVYDIRPQFLLCLPVLTQVIVGTTAAPALYIVGP